jgi:hypothetical protein
MKHANYFLMCAIGIALFSGGDGVFAQSVYVREVRVTGEGDTIFGPSLELEVHVYEVISQGSARFLGCSGENQGLRSVDASDIHYVGLSGFFQKPGGGNLALADVENKSIYLITSEDDENPCPVQYGGVFPFSDDLIGMSENFSGNQLASLKLMAFGRVQHLLLGAGGYSIAYQFTDQSHVLGGSFKNSNGGCWGDFDNDGDSDLFIPNGQRSGIADKNQLFLNRGDGSFQEVTSGVIAGEGGNSNGCTCADYDNDGDVDLFVANDGPNFLYANNGNATFTKITAGPVVTDNLKSTGAAWGDYDKDGDLDLFVTNGSDQRNSFYINLGNGAFAQADPANVIVNEAGNSTGCTWVDYDGDSNLDLFVTNTGNRRNFLYRNLGGGAFVKVTSGDLVTDNHSSLGASWADYDNDGDPDVIVTNGAGQRNILYTNNGNGDFSKRELFYSSTLDSTGIGSSWGDFDNDGDQDMFVTSPGGIYLNDLSQGGFYRTAGYGVASTGFARSCSWSDYDGDGQLDLFVARFGFPNFLYRNDGGNNNWLKVRCRGTVSNRSAIGTKVRAKATINGRPLWQLHEISAQTGHAAQNALEAHFGFAQASIVDSLVIFWPAGGMEVLANVAVNQVLNVTESMATSVEENAGGTPATFALAQNYPNPFNPSTTIKYELAQPVEVKLEIFDIMGRHVRTLVNQTQPAGRYTMVWDGRNEQGEVVASGVFIYKLRAGSFEQARRMALVR